MPLVLEGKQLHNQVLKLGFGSEIIIQTALINMYGFFGELECMRSKYNFLVCNIQHAFTGIGSLPSSAVP
ncbi:hypothetical protein ACFX13_039826 [Malus domestica]